MLCDVCCLSCLCCWCGWCGCCAKERDCGHKTCRSWLMWRGSLFRSTVSKNRGWYSLSWEVSWPGRRGLQGAKWVQSEGSTSPMSCLTQRRVQCASGSSLVVVVLYQQQHHQDMVEPRRVPTEIGDDCVLLFHNNNIVDMWLSRIESQPRAQ